MSTEERCFCLSCSGSIRDWSRYSAGVVLRLPSCLLFCSRWGLGGGARWGGGGGGAWRDGQPLPPGHCPPVDTHPRPWARSPTPPGFLSLRPLSPAEGGLSREPGHRKGVLWLPAKTSPFLPQPHCPGSGMRGRRWEQS